MNVSKQFLCDFAYLANLYGWTAADIEDIKAQTRENSDEMRLYWTQLAIAHRAGYSQTAENNFVRLGYWRQMKANAATDEPDLPAAFTCAHEGAS